MLIKMITIILLLCVAGTAAATMMQTTQDANLYYAPDKQIGVLKTGAQVKVLKEQGEWAFVRYANDKIVVQGWVKKALLAPATEPPVDPLKGLQNQKN